ncbi:4Fe-4S ferredoxin [Geothermobacter hydrogeniphilus]|uniref:4Fe-4S ferredoxin n=1 Tax=Geothermobacter hydrogeniphilus TaxID=1969733 RepID=A0A1X0Y298_9BACT|nr:4Fe-4S ferredoxin [Geothermobacter hydrogeniphilus]ORJ59295.1 4Fe-4S ferredoxin [Geothermobacter hydrogeniphilus]
MSRKKKTTEELGSARWVENLIHEFWATSPQNTLANGTGEKAWDKPLIGFARADHPLFRQYAADFAPFYWTPEQAFQLAFPEAPATAEELSVISWVLPQTAATRTDQAQVDKVPAERWARSRDFGERFNCALRLHLAAVLTAAGYPAAAPERLPDFGFRRSERFGLASNWSERHTAHAAGLGTFGLSDGLITRRGKAIRIGSVVARIDLPGTPLPYDHHQAWCLWHTRGICRECVRRCPADAISDAGHDKDKCFAYIQQVTAPYAQQTFGTEATPCGLCQVGIPCEARIPA